MADNVTFQATVIATPPSATVIATDDVGGVQFQQVKLDIGASGASSPVTSGNPLPVSVSGTVTLPTGASTAALQTTGNTSLASIDGKITAVNTGAVVVSSSALPSGAATVAKQPALGTAGTPSADVISVQGVGGGTALPISGTVTATVANATISGNVTVVQPTGTNLHAVLDSTSTTAVTQATGTNLHTVIDSGTLTTVSTVTAVTAISNALPAGNNNIGDVDVASVTGNVTVVQGTATNLKAEVIGAGTAGTANAGVVTVQGIAAMTPLLVTPAANSAVNVAQLAGTATSVNAGTKDAGTLRTVLATDSTAVSTAGFLSVKVDQTTPGTTNLVATSNFPTTVDTNSGNKSASTLREVLATDQPALTTAGVFSVKIDQTTDGTTNKVSADLSKVAGGTAITGGVTGSVATGGNKAHDDANAGNPDYAGGEAIAFGTNPTAVAAADRTKFYANRAGIPFTLGGHPNARTAVYLTTGSQTDDNVLAAISSGLKYCITRYEITLDQATTVGVAVRLGFGTANVPALPSSGADAVEGILMYHPGLVPGSGIVRGDGSAVLGIGGDGEELRITCGAPTSGTLVVAVTFFTIES